MNRLILTLALAAALPAAHASVGAPDLSKVNGSLTAEAGTSPG